MEIIQYKVEKKYKQLFGRLVKDIYKKYPKVIDSKIKDYYNCFNLLNPALKYFDFVNIIIIEKGDPLGHISAIVDKRLDKFIGFIGYFECLNNKKYAKLLIAEACRVLEQKNKRKIIGPINFSVWQTFRQSIGKRVEPYELEPFSMSYYSRFFIDNKFSPFKTSVSKRQAISESRYSKNNVYFEKKEDNFIFKIVSFKEAFAYRKKLRNIIYDVFKEENRGIFLKISQKEFDYIFKEYAKKKIYFVCLCFKASRIVGFCFFAKDNSETAKNIVLKTMGVLSSYRGRNIGNILLQKVADFARNINYQYFIYSTIDIDNLVSNRLFEVENGIIRFYHTYVLNK